MAWCVVGCGRRMGAESILLVIYDSSLSLRCTEEGFLIQWDLAAWILVRGLVVEHINGASSGQVKRL